MATGTSAILWLFVIIGTHLIVSANDCKEKLYFRQCQIACKKENSVEYDIKNKPDGSRCKTLMLKSGYCIKGRCSTDGSIPDPIYEDFTTVEP